MKLSDYEGKSIREIDSQNNGKVGISWRFVISIIIPGLLLILLGYGLASFYLHGKINRLNASIADLQMENGILKEEKALMQSQLAEMQVASGSTDFIYHDVKHQDTLGSISVKYYGTGRYAAELAKLNGLTVRTTLHVGQIIKVPRKPQADWKKN